MKSIIFRVDDRLIHGQVVEGWIKNFRIPRVAIANDEISAGPVQQLIYRSVVPPKTDVMFYSLDGLMANWPALASAKGTLLVLFSSVSDLAYCEPIISGEIYINIGCIACRSHVVELSDTVYLNGDELACLSGLAKRWKIHIKKLPWEKDAAINYGNCGD